MGEEAAQVPLPVAIRNEAEPEDHAEGPAEQAPAGVRLVPPKHSAWSEGPKPRPRGAIYQRLVLTGKRRDAEYAVAVMAAASRIRDTWAARCR